ncbi:pro-sigmaK processing inhibitor BofA family protein [Thermoanaerobacterium sp. CMT5567-10]|uniref:pro-sigmaK processing inhibitor BofA family protein n=1 Tax=Thermoanaerobacterium sp. CMT5567-10 TaxID=3061989 RepID=UPI0026DEB15D|nr:pro-sigmaK processing inhibitor BofA family protein [Thermoanaerobacterium sp. CMT5567-10]WKV09323.1 pro-sigmaK processing inhibitor BofA family protein [Thermoanaerobacterium sp. CMT5567-10]
MLLPGFSSFAIGIIIIAFIVWLFGKSVKILFKFVLNSIIGYVFLLIFNFFGSIFGLTLQINLINAFIAGVFGIPGIVVLLALKYIFKIII